MGKMPMQQWYPDAHIADTTNLTLEEQGAYRLLMDHMWIKGGAIKDDDAYIARYLRISVKRWQKIRERLTDYLLAGEGFITQKRLQNDYEKACITSKKNAENGKIGGKKSSENRKQHQANALAKNGDSATSAPRLHGQARSLGEVMNQLELKP